MIDEDRIEASNGTFCWLPQAASVVSAPIRLFGIDFLNKL